jgi:cytochrome c-type biogenesis protein CcmH/NrfF
MKCPYCISAIDDEASVCPHCTRDLYLLKPLLAKVGELEKKLAALEVSLGGIDQAAAPADVVAVPAAEESLPPPRGTAMLWLAPLLLLLAAHALITVVYDLDTIYLRIVSLLIPLPFGMLLLSRHPGRFGLYAAGAFLMATLAVLGMSGITHLVDHTAVLPQDRREWGEFIEYAASIALSYVTGMVLGHMLWQRRETAKREQALQLAQKLVRLVSTGQDKVDRINAAAKKLQELSGTLVAAGTTAASLYMGLHGLIGK